MDEARESSWSTLLEGGRAGRSALLTGAVTIHALSVYVVATILPGAVRELGGVPLLAWTITTAVVGGICGAASVAPLLARLGPRAAYRAALTAFAAGSMMCAIAPSMEMLLGGRLLQGLGGGLMSALAYALVRNLFAPGLHARAIAMMGTAWGVAALLGPAFGGFVAAFGDWRLAFWIDVPLALLVALLAQMVLPPDNMSPGSAKKMPVGRLGMVAAAATAVSLGGIYGSFWPAITGCVAAVLLVVLVIRADKRGTSRDHQRLFPAGVFVLRTRFGAITCVVALVAASGSAIIYVPYVVTTAHGYPAVAGGFMSALSALSWTIASLLCASATGARARTLVVIGPVIMTIGVACTGPALASGNLVGIAAAIAPTGVGIGLAWPHLGALLIATADESEREAAGSFISTVQMFAAAFGSALVGMIANAAGMGQAVDDPAAIAAAGRWLFVLYSIVPATAFLMALHALVLKPWKDAPDD